MPRRANNSTRKATQVSASLVAAGKAVAKAAAYVAEMKAYVKERAAETLRVRAQPNYRKTKKRNTHK